MEVLEGGGVLESPLGCMGWVYGTILGGFRESFVVILDLSWEIDPRLDFDMIFCIARIKNASSATLVEFLGGSIL